MARGDTALPTFCKPVRCGMLGVVRSVVIWLCAALVGRVIFMRSPPVLGVDASYAVVVAVVGVPLVTLIALRRARAAAVALSGVIVGVMGTWMELHIEWDIRCAQPVGPGQVACSMLGEPSPLAIAATIVAAAVLLGLVAARITRTRRIA